MMKLPLRQRKKAQTAERIEAAATDLFERQGFEATTLEQIAEAADVHRQTVLRYFGSKEDIAFASRNELYERFAEGLAKRSGSVLDHWRGYIAEASRGVTETGVLRRWFDFLASDERLYAYQLRLNQKFQDALAAALSQEAGVDPDTDLFARVLAATLVSGNTQVARMTVNNGQDAIVARNSGEVIDLAATLQREP